MELREYLLKYGVSQTRFSEMCGVSVVTINNICQGKKRSTVALALRIEEMSGDRVDPQLIVAEHNKYKVKKAREYNINKPTI